MRVRLLAWVSVISLFTSVLAAPAFADDEPNKLFVRNSPAQFLVGDPSRESENYQLQVLVEGNNPGMLTVGFVDTLVIEGQTQLFPAGTLETSLINAITLLPIDLNYIPNGKTQNFDLEFSARSDLKSLIYSGAIRIAFAPESEEAGSAVSAGVSKNLLVSLFGAELVAEGSEFAALRVLETRVKTLARSSFIDSLLPDIPGLVNAGPVDALIRFDNPSGFPIEATVEWEFFQRDELLARKKLNQGLSYRGDSRAIAAQSIFVDGESGRSINVLPAFGFVTVRITLSSSLVGKPLPDEIREHSFLVAPWKEIVALLFALLMLRALYGRYKKRLENKDKGKALSPVN